MKKPELPVDESSRIAALNSLGIVYSPVEERFDRITRIAKRMFDVPIALISLVAADQQWFKSCQGLTVAETPREISFCGHAILMDEPLVISDTLKNPDFADNPLVVNEPFIRFYAGQTISFLGKKIGTLCVIDSKPREFRPSDLDSLTSLAAWIENELTIAAMSEVQQELISSRDEAQRKALIDPLTGGWNRQGIEEVLALAFPKAKHRNSIVTIMKIDLDEIRYLNDSHLHTGDEVTLKEVAQRIRTTVRSADVVARFDEHELLVFLENCNKETARTLAQNCLRNVAIEPIQVPNGDVMATISIGMACNEGTDEWDMDKMIALADSALYDAKIDGGNRSMLGVYELQPD